MSRNSSCLSVTNSVIGVLFAAASVTGIAMSLFLIFGDPLPEYYNHQDTYDPNWEDIGPALVISVVSLLANVLLIGGSRQLSKDFLLVWIVWKSIAIVLFWIWYGYNQLKAENYIDWRPYGMKQCYFCKRDEATYVVFGGIILTALILLCMIPVALLRSRLKKRHRELTEPLGQYNSAHNLSPYQHQHQYEMYQQQQNDMLRRQVQQKYDQYPPPTPTHQYTDNVHQQEYYPPHHEQQQQHWQYYPAHNQHHGMQYHH